MYYPRDGELCHHGVKGMKWGVRRTPEQLGRTSGKHRTPEQNARNKKAAAELKGLRKAHEDSEEGYKKYIEIQNLITSKSADAYEEIPKTTGTKKLFDRITRLREQEHENDVQLYKRWSEIDSETLKKYPKAVKGDHVVNRKEFNRYLNEVAELRANDPQLKAYNERGERFCMQARRVDDLLVGQILRDIGYENTRTARKEIRDIVFWD